MSRLAPIGVRLSPEKLAALEALATRGRCSVNSIIAVAVDQLLAQVRSTPPEDFPTPAEFDAYTRRLDDIFEQVRRTIKASSSSDAKLKTKFAAYVAAVGGNTPGAMTNQQWKNLFANIKAIANKNPDAVSEICSQIDQLWARG